MDLKEIPTPKAGVNMQINIDEKMQNIWQQEKESDSLKLSGSMHAKSLSSSISNLEN